MSSGEFETYARDKTTLARSGSVKIANRPVSLPSRPFTATRTRLDEINVLRENRLPSQLVEVRLSLKYPDLERIKDDGRFESKISQEVNRALEKSSETGSVPYLRIALTDASGNPLNSIPDIESLAPIIELLQHSKNSLIIPPYFGPLIRNGEIGRFVSLLDSIMAIKNGKYLVGWFPLNPRTIVEELATQYWKRDIRFFGIDLSNRTFEANELPIRHTMNILRGKARAGKQEICMMGFGPRVKRGRGDETRISDLLGVALGFDIIVPPAFSRPVAIRSSKDAPLPEWWVDTANYGYQLTKPSERFPNEPQIPIPRVYNNVALSSEINKLSKRIESQDLFPYWEKKRCLLPEDLESIRSIVKNVKTGWL
jgi:hypothetical protein